MTHILAEMTGSIQGGLGCLGAAIGVGLVGFKAAEAVAIPEWMEYGAISGLSREMLETLERVRPATIGQASRIPGVTPAALSLVHVSIRVQGARRLAS